MPEAFLITTAGADSRRYQAMQGLAELGGELRLNESVTVRTFERDVEDGARGCYASHLAIYREAIERGMESAMIFEDNLVFTAPKVEAEQGAREELGTEQFLHQLEWASQAGDTWDVLHLTYVHSAASLRLVRPGGSEDTPVMQIERTAPDWYGFIRVEQLAGLGTTAYVISRRAMKALVALDASAGYTGTPIDELLASYFPNTTFGAYPTVLHRGLAPSLINPGQELFRKIMYNPKVFRPIEWALAATGLSSSQLVCAVLGFLLAWTLLVVFPVTMMLAGK